MSSQHAPPQQRRAKPEPPTVTTIYDLGDDLVLQIFLRLPSLPCLVRAALACHAFLAAVRSSPAFRRLFRALHPPPLLGFFFETEGLDIPSFTPIRRRSDPDLTAAVRGADVFLTRVPYHDDASPGWYIEDCHCGYLLLRNRDTEQIAAYNPLTRALDLLPMPSDTTKDDHYGKLHRMGFFLLSSDESSFRVITVCHDKLCLRGAVFQSSTKAWEVLPWSVPAPEQSSGKKKKHWLLCATRVNGNLHMAHTKHPYEVVLDADTLEFSFADLPEHLKGKRHLYMNGETRDGKECIVSVIGFTLHVWFRRANSHGVESDDRDNAIRWRERERFFGLSPRAHGRIMGGSNSKCGRFCTGVVYFSFFECIEPASATWFLSFCLETRKLEKLFHKRFHNGIFPYIMAWPPSSVDNHVSL